MIKINDKRFPFVMVGLAAMVSCLLYLVACGGTVTERVEVQVEVKNPYAVDFEKYDKILYREISLEWPAKDFHPREQLDEFFLEDLPKTIEKKIEPWNQPPDSNEGMPPNSVLVTGKLTLEIKERSKIKEVKDETGKPKNVFTAVQHWDLTMSVVMKETGTGKKIFKQEFAEKLSNVDTSDTTTKFNFETIFFKITNRLVLKLRKTKEMQRRFLLH